MVMKPQWHRLFIPYSHKSASWTMAMLLCIALLPVLLKSLTMFILQNTLPAWIVILFDFLGLAGGWLLFILAIWQMDGHPRTGFRSMLWQSFSQGGLWLLAIAQLSAMINTFYLKYGGLLVITGKPARYVVGQVVVVFGNCLVLAVVLFWTLCIMADPDHHAAFGRSLQYWLRHPLPGLGSILAGVALIYVIPLLYDYIIQVFPLLALSFLTLAASAILLSLLQWTVLQPLLSILFRYARQLAARQPAYQQPVPAAGQKRAMSFVRRQFSIILAIVLMIAVGLYNMLYGNALSPAGVVKQDLQEYFANAELMGDAGDPAAAAYYENIAEARILAWQGAVLNKANALDQAVAMAPFDTQIQLLSALQSTNSLALLEHGFLNGDHSQSRYLALLNAYAKSASLTEVQKRRKAEILRICILQGYFVQTDVLPADLSANRDEFAGMLDGFSESLAFGKHYTLLAHLGAYGSVTRELVFEALKLAETYPDEINLQYLAMAYGGTHLEDNADYYGRTANAALRYDTLYMEQNKNTASEEQIFTEKLTVARALMTIEQTETCAKFLASLTSSSPELSMINASCQYSLDNFGQCLQATADVLKSQPDNPQALYLAALCSLQLKKTTDSLAYAIRLSQVVKAAEDPLASEQLLYPYLLRLTINEGQANYATSVYGSLSQQDKALLASDELLSNYAAAVYLWAQQTPESRNAALENITKVLNVRGDLSRALYLKGAIYSDLLNNEQALAFLKSSLALDAEQPTSWYALALLYDRMKSYNEAYAACQKVLQYLPTSDHTSDVFGVSVHASLLMTSLEPYVKEGK